MALIFFFDTSVQEKKQAVCFLLVIGVHIAALIFAVDSFAQHEKSSSAMRNELRQRYDGVGVNVYSQRFGQLQESYECCGVNGVTDYTAELEAFERYNANLGTLRSFPPRSCLGADDEVSSQQAVCFLLVIGVHIAALIFAVDSFAQHEKSSSAMRNELRQRYDGVGVNVYSQRFGQLQESYECCGVNGVTDYTAELEAFERYNANLGTLRSFPPRSCLGADDEVSPQGCHESVKNALYNLYVSILVLSSVSIFCALLLFVLAICLCVRYKEDAIITHL
ncbi:uncharacterized protein LOC135463495 [Liolophura sinensis]|uniref:uncharacterized protein LOC135463495 n=1 Tax=Liolophura sinensis TaxID=3198878 RepID=UPI003158487F